MNKLVTTKLIRRCAAVLAIVVMVSPGAAFADGLTPLYSYNFAGTTGTVANTGTYNPTLNLTLLGNWTPSATGVNFTGDTVSQQSIAYAKPASGYTLNLTAAQAVGFGVRFTYQAPATGCFSDSPNITQIGRFAAKAAQAKLQFSNCSKGKKAVYMQCRFAGSLTPASVLPVTSTMALTNGATYVASCNKTADTNGVATVSLTVTKLDSVNGNSTTMNSFSVAATGVLQSKEAISVANKYPLPAIGNNTDQFVGDVSKVSYCASTVSLDVPTCLANELMPVVATTIAKQ